MECSRKMSVEVSSVHTAEALEKGTRSYTPAALGNSSSVSLALLSSIASTSTLLGCIATAVPARPTDMLLQLLNAKNGNHKSECLSVVESTGLGNVT